MNRHLPDLYAALLQLIYAPLSAYDYTKAVEAVEAKNVSQSAMPSKITTPADLFLTNPGAIMSGISQKDKEKCSRAFMWLFEKSDVYRAMESLMLLLGTSPLHPVPVWMRSICGRYLSRILLRPNGIAIVLDFTIGDSDQVQFSQLEKIAKLIMSVPQQIPSVESYYAIIAPQLLGLLQSVVRASQQKTPKAQAITFVIGRMIIKHTSLTKEYIIDKVVGPLTTYWHQEEYYKEGDTLTSLTTLDPQVIAEEDLKTLLHTLHCIMVGGEPSPLVIQSFLTTLVPIFYHLYESSIKYKSNLRETVLDLLTTYFRITSTREIIGDLKRVLLDTVDLSHSRVAYFAPGPTGGVVLRLRRKVSSNHMSMDPKIMIEFLGGIGSPDLCGDFFVFLLNEYTAMQTVSQDTDPKSILMMLHLIMGMLDALGPEILKKPTQVVAFANNVVTEYVDRKALQSQSQSQKQSSGVSFHTLANIVSEEDKEAIEDLQDDTYTPEDDFESLLLAINLLRAVIHENDDLDSQTIQLFESVIEPLKQLEKHDAEVVQASAHEVILAVTTCLSAQRVSDAHSKLPSMEASKKKYQEAMKALQDDLLPVRAHGIGMLKEMVLSRDPLVSSGSGLDNVLDIFVRLLQDEDSFIYLNAVKGLSALTDIHGNSIIIKLGIFYSNDEEKLENRLRIGEALLQTVQRCGDALSKYGKWYCVD
ncbi:hypothetical protein BDF14DRAFT_1875694 [Spinellus fusiger]|nr:hypothetical protein BDF14DRAFT_1875694 [Spinellus fusiger]